MPDSIPETTPASPDKCESAGYRRTATAFLVVLCGLAFAIVMVLTAPSGPGISTDSVQYIAAADSLARGNGFITFSGQPFVYFPPLYPLLLALPKWLFGIDPLLTARIANALALSATVLLTGLIFWAEIPSNRWWGILAAASLVASPSFLSLHSNVLSDPPFIVLVLSFLLVARQYLHRPSSGLLLCAALISSLAVLLRYLGAMLLAPAILVLWFSYGRSLREVVMKGTLFAAIPAVPLTIWLTRNMALVGSAFGNRAPSTWMPLENTLDLIRKVTHWFVPYEVILLRAVIVFVAIFTVVLGWRARRSRPGNVGSSPSIRPFSIVVASFVLAYACALVVTIATPEHFGISYDDRYYLPLYVPLLLLLCLAFKRVLPVLMPALSAPKSETLLLAVFLLWLLYPIYFGVRLAWRSVSRGWIPFYNIYNTPSFWDSAVTRWLQQGNVSNQELIYSNQSAAAYLTLRRPVEPSPVNRASDETWIPIEEYRGRWPGQTGALLLWYEVRKDTAYPPDELRRLAELDPIWLTGDAGAYIIRTR